MQVAVHAYEVSKIDRYDSDGKTMLTVRVLGGSQVDFFLPTERADILFPALQKVYENVQEKA